LVAVARTLTHARHRNDACAAISCIASGSFVGVGLRELPVAPGPPSVAPPLPFIILRALGTELSGLRFTIPILKFTSVWRRQAFPRAR
jgi:hypothetical protein